MRVLLHICCGPCAMMPLAVLGPAENGEGHDLAGYFDNPNIQPLSEYLRRRESAVRAADRAGIPVLFPAAENEYNAASWCRDALAAPFGGRCTFCLSSRLDRTARRAEREGFEAFTSSLLYSRRQDHEGIARAGEEAAARHGVAFLYRDFRPLWQDGVRASKAAGLYRQQYCGCLFSEEERYARDFQRAAEN
jgi:predicted adenine nucleotide alpha hydrolase (AANH) superfamily ATPase